VVVQVEGDVVGADDDAVVGAVDEVVVEGRVGGDRVAAAQLLDGGCPAAAEDDDTDYGQRQDQRKRSERSRVRRGGEAWLASDPPYWPRKEPARINVKLQPRATERKARSPARLASHLTAKRRVRVRGPRCCFRVKAEAARITAFRSGTRRVPCQPFEVPAPPPSDHLDQGRRCHLHSAR
jgi:hypothetical protein